MLKELFDAISRQAINSGPRILKTNSDPDNVYFVANGDGSLLKMTADRKAFCRAAHDPESLAAWLADNGDDLGLSAVFVSANKTTAILDTENVNSDCITIEQRATEAATRMEGLWNERKTARSQKDLLKLLRTYFTDAMPEGLYDSLKTVRFSRNEGGQTTTAQGKASLGKTIASELAGVKEIPEVVTFRIRIFDDINFTGNVQDVRCYLDVDADEMAFRFYPLADDMSNATNEAIKMLALRITSLLDANGYKAPVYLGAA